jgi:hypothetical protein
MFSLSSKKYSPESFSASNSDSFSLPSLISSSTNILAGILLSFDIELL